MNYSIKDISDKLSARSEEVCRMLLPEGKKNGEYWEVGDATGGEGKSCKIKMEGEYSGKWMDWAEQEKGDLVDLWQHAKGLTRPQALAEIKDFLGIVEDKLYLVKKKKYLTPEEDAKIKALDDRGKAVKYLNGRGIDNKTINRFQIQGDGENIVYPSFGYGGNHLLNRSFHKLERVDGKKVVRQEKGCAPSLFGWQALDEAAIKGRRILICEGQIDAMTWTQWRVPALSVPNGSDCSWIDYEWVNLEMFSEIFLSFDMDEAGQETMRKVMSRLGLHRCRVVNLPHKDANECLQKGMTEEEAAQCLLDATYPRHEGLAPASTFIEETIEEFHPNLAKPRGFRPNIMQRQDGGFNFLPGDVTIWTGISNHGKTTFLSYLMSLVLMEGGRVLIGSFENRPSEVIASILRAVMKSPMAPPEFLRFQFDDLEGRLFFINRAGFITRPELLEVMQFAYARHGVNHVVIDSLMTVAGLEEDYPAQGDFLNDLQAFSKTTDAHVHLVAHPRKTMDETMPSKLDVKGSSLIMNRCDNIAVVHKNMSKHKLKQERPLTEQEDLDMFDTQIVSEKQRKGGWGGKILLRFDQKTATFSKFDPNQITI